MTAAIRPEARKSVFPGCLASALVSAHLAPNLFSRKPFSNLFTSRVAPQWRGGGGGGAHRCRGLWSWVRQYLGHPCFGKREKSTHKVFSHNAHRSECGGSQSISCYLTREDLAPACSHQLDLKTKFTHRIRKNKTSKTSHPQLPRRTAWKKPSPHPNQKTAKT